ncbi:hypothetical protein PR202_gb27543 [Eleusine coracana subsp. coracana]|uniref:MORF/ORRM1/DAG-like MORF domain-containing protein n=1 Tax=Eleusine coracana subsp. coracana TaxID=191504 RepID=A0AAV5FUQ9_ELECO|nr:hypothetical protein PR202_gb27543 [Eleusine coracana subsp. coracana]
MTPRRFSTQRDASRSSSIDNSPPEETAAGNSTEPDDAPNDRNSYQMIFDHDYSDDDRLLQGCDYSDDDDRLLHGCDLEHWLVVMRTPPGGPYNPTTHRDELIDSYIKTLAQVVGSEEEAKQKIYSVSTRYYFAFGALVSEELSHKLKELPDVVWVLPDSYVDVENKDYGGNIIYIFQFCVVGEPFINSEAVPYDPKYHEEWVRNHRRCQHRLSRFERSRREPFINGEAVPYDPKYHEEWVRNNEHQMDDSRRHLSFERSRSFETHTLTESKQGEQMTTLAMQHTQAHMPPPPDADGAQQPQVPPVDEQSDASGNQGNNNNDGETHSEPSENQGGHNQQDNKPGDAMRDT